MKPEFHSPQISDEIVSKLPFIQKKYKYLFYPGDKSSVVKHVADLFSIDETAKEKIIALLKGGAMVSLKPKAKGYILPNCMYTKIQLKQICKILNFSTTENVELADFIIGNSNICSLGLVNGQLQSNLIAANVQGAEYTISENTPGYMHAHLKAQFPIGTDVLLSRLVYNSHDTPDDMETGGYRIFIPSKTVNIVYHILAKSLPVINELNISNTVDRVIIDEHMYDTLCSMLNSTEGDRKIAVEMIFNCNYVKSVFYIWKLVSVHSGTINKLLTTKQKDLIHDQIGYYQMVRSLSADEFIVHLSNRNLLNEELYDIIVDEIIEDMTLMLSRGRNNDCNQFITTTYSSKQSYQEYLIQTQPQTVSPNSTQDDNIPF